MPSGKHRDFVSSEMASRKDNRFMNISAEQGIAELIQAKSDSILNKAAFAIAKKQLDVGRAQGDAIVEWVAQAVNVQQQIQAGHLDVKA